MNILDLQDKLKNLSEEQLISQMQAPTGEVPQFLLLSEITRRQKMRDSFSQAQGQEQSTVAQDAIATAGLPQDAAQQLAGSMAPQTDMAGNAGAVGGQPVMPPAQPQPPMGMAGAAGGQPPPPMGMAGGGIVALQEGGRVQRQPRLVVSGGRQFIEMPDGNLILPEMLGFTESDMAGAGMADLAQPQPIDRSFGANPSYREDRAEVSPTPAMPQLDFLQPRLPEADMMPMPMSYAPMPMPMSYAPMGGADMPGAAGISQPFDLEMAPLADEFTTMPPMPPESISGAPATAPTVDSILATPLPHTGPGMGVRHASGQSGPIQPDAPRRGFLPEGLGESVRDAVRDTATLLSPFASPDEQESAAMRRDPTSRQTTGDPLEVPTNVSDLLPPQADPTTTAPGPSGGGAGGIASVAGAAGAAPTDFEQELLSMLAAREKRAEQDKWLSLAQFGLQLMSSNQPNIGAAIGEAGGPALDALRSSRESYDADRLGLLGTLDQSRLGREELNLRRQAAAARAAASSRAKPIPAAVLTAINRQITDLRGMMPDGPAERDQIDREIARLSSQANQVLSTYGLGSSGASEEDYDYVTQ